MKDCDKEFLLEVAKKIASEKLGRPYYKYYFWGVADNCGLEKIAEAEHRRLLNCSDAPKGLSSKSVEVLKKYREVMKND